MGRFTKLDQELRAGRERIKGHRAEDALRWLLDRFVQPKKPIKADDGTDLSPTEVDQLGFEVQAFQDYDWGEKFRQFGMVSSSGRSHKVERGQVYANIMNKDTLVAIQREIVLLIERFLSDRWVPQHVNKVTFELIKMEGEDQPPMLLLEGEPAEAVVLRCFFLLAAVGHKLRRCKAHDCLRLFVFQHGKKRFCSLRCQRRIGTQRWRKGEKEEKSTREQLRIKGSRRHITHRKLS